MATKIKACRYPFVVHCQSVFFFLGGGICLLVKFWHFLLLHSFIFHHDIVYAIAGSCIVLPSMFDL